MRACCFVFEVLILDVARLLEQLRAVLKRVY
jgi:hypothetical protein